MEQIQRDKNINLEHVLIELGFSKINSYFIYNLNVLSLKASIVTDFSYSDVYYFTGTILRERERSIISFKIPVYVNSFEQGLAMLSYYLRNDKLDKIIPWINEGLKLEAKLPWFIDIKAYENCPRIKIQSGWIRDTFKQIRDIAKNSNETDITSIFFDGKLIKIDSNNNLFQFKAEGEIWQSEVQVYTKDLLNLPKRIPDYEISIYLYNKSINILYRKFQLI